MYVAAAGLTPIFPVIEVVPVVEIPVFVKIAKFPAVPRTLAGTVFADTLEICMIPNNAMKQKRVKITLNRVIFFFFIQITTLYFAV
jgi:hypothetical protein